MQSHVFGTIIVSDRVEFCILEYAWYCMILIKSSSFRPREHTTSIQVLGGKTESLNARRTMMDGQHGSHGVPPAHDTTKGDLVGSPYHIFYSGD